MLSHIKVLDFSTLLPGPYASLLLADMGAEVLRIESPTRVDLVKHLPPVIGKTSAAHQYLNRSKKSIALDLKQSKSIDIVKKLIKEYDVILEQFRPEVMKKLGLDYETLSKINPKLIYCSITGYGQTGPYKDKAGHDLNYLAIAGISSYSKRKDQAPVPQGIQIADVAGGSLHAVIGILAAVTNRDQTGQGRFIDISMTDCAFTLNAISAAGAVTHNLLPQSESELLNGGSFYDYYQTADNRYMAVGSLEPKFYQGLCQVLACEDLKDFANEATKQPLIKSRFTKVFKTKTQQQWQTIFADLDLCVEPVLTMLEACEHPQLIARNMLSNVPHQQTGRQKQLSFPIKFSNFKANYQHVGKNLGEDSKAILSNMDYTDQDIEQLIQAGVVK